jgi:ADP-heptose:LPS heptosyltransferase
MGIRPLETILYAWMKARKSRDDRMTDLSALDRGRVRNILAVSSTAIGDTLISTPAIRAIRKSYSEARITALLNRDNMELFANNPNIDNFVPYHGGYKGFFKTAGRLKDLSIDLAVILHGNEPQATPLAYLSGADFIVKLPNDSRFNFLLSNRTPVAGWQKLGHGINIRLKATELVGCAPDGVEMDLFVEKEDERGAEEFLKETGAAGAEILIGFQPGASTVSRRWFPERFVELGKKLIKDSPGVRIILTGSPSERPLCEDIAKNIGPGAIPAAGRITLKETAALIKRLGVLVTGDTGPMHMAIAQKTPVVALFAVADPATSGPLYDLDLHTVIKKDRTCEPCLTKRCTYQECMEQISVNEVLSAIKKTLKAPA